VTRQRLLRIGFLALLAAGLVLWAKWRAPRQVAVVVDLAEALPGDMSGLDVIVTRSGRALARIDRRYGASGAPQRERVELRAAEGAADVEATAVYRARPAVRSRAALELREEAAAVVIVTRHEAPKR